jgi:hypothetical protein
MSLAPEVLAKVPVSVGFTVSDAVSFVEVSEIVLGTCGFTAAASTGFSSLCTGMIRPQNKNANTKYETVAKTRSLLWNLKPRLSPRIAVYKHNSFEIIIAISGINTTKKRLKKMA